MTCAQLAGMAIPASAIGLPTGGGTVTTAAVVAASGTGAAAVPEHCLVNASIAPVDPTSPSILFRLALPTQWNGKAVMFGGGGFDGTIPSVAGNVPAGPSDQPTPLGRGYATFASDSGHQAGAAGSLDGEFLLNEEATRNFGGHALKKTRDAAVHLLRQRYGTNGPTRSYFAGGSTGGREALSVAQRWPADWDGVIAWYPAWNQLSAMLGGHRASRAMAQPGAYPNNAKRILVRDAALQACDALDGVADGIVSRQQQCNALFDPALATFNGTPVRCPGGADTGDTCLSDAQIAALKTMNTATSFNFFLASGSQGYPGYNVWGADLGITSTPPVGLQATVAFLNLGSTAPAMPMPAGAPYISKQLDQVIKNAVTRDPAFNSLTLDPENPGPWANRLSELSTMLDVSPDLSAFVARGGKLLLAHGTSDVLVSARATEQFYQRLRAQFGPATVDTFARYYEVPGYGHAVSTMFNAAWDSLTALERWVEQGTAPSGQVVTDTAGVPGRTRPLCDHPRWPQYRGSGNVNLAASFTCAN
ncbi:tannase/feruloyl esterase family alpha/beta hydrolase [Aquabacterium sp. J223]|uniref:tannase/feruloyl esterase family alpha/beta hydrolase n=1 Tax=Aquabacterium sp. J223 TaxID=2898431 RepID=UPI0021ADCB67|nr:tannase/feruloyl esterase family alpha/beta hydrolase [Aquabacterium sp. J223]UUX96707.1 tannase/feruloyl esterase family alpha/beta hydrolase [Aquabacterium sp. J223]